MPNIRGTSTTLEPSRDWIAAFKLAIVDAGGVPKVAAACKVSRTALWAAVADPKRGRQRVSIATIYKVVAHLNERGARIPPPFLVVGGPSSSTWKLAAKG